MKNLLGMHKSRDLETKVRKRQKGMSGKQIALFVGGGFLVCVVIFFLLNNWVSLTNSVLATAQGWMGIEKGKEWQIPVTADTGKVTG